MPLNNRTEAEAQRLKGVDLFDDSSDVELGMFTSLVNWVPGKLYSLKKKRGVDVAPGGAMLPISVVNPFDAVAILCGTEPVMVCGDQLICVMSGISITTCNGIPLVALNGNEITCA